MAETSKRFAVVTGGNKGIGFEICRQLACNGILVVLTARDEKRGLEAVQKLKDSAGFSSDLIIFHLVDVADQTSITSLAEFIKTRFGKLDILVNNAAIAGGVLDEAGLIAVAPKIVEGLQVNLDGVATETYESAVECLKINYYGAKRMAEALIPLLQLSDSPRIVNVTSSAGKLLNVSDERAKQVFRDAENLTEDRIDQVLSEHLKHFKEGSPVRKGWIAYGLSKAALNAYTRILAKKYPSFHINCVCPGHVRTDINFHTGNLSAEEGAESPVRLALLPNGGGPSGLFFFRKEEATF